MEHPFGTGTMIQDSFGPHRFSRHAQRHRLPARLALMVASAAAGLVIVGGVAYAGSSNTGDRVVVHPGQTLWGIAESHYPGTNVQQAVTEIESANHLNGAEIRPGEALYLPAP
jgi:nucleoid-associated protein YgaU